LPAFFRDIREDSTRDAGLRSTPNGSSDPSALTKTVSSIGTSRGCALWRGGTILRALNNFALAICVSAVVGAFGFLLLLYPLICGGLRVLSEQRRQQERRQCKD